MPDGPAPRPAVPHWLALSLLALTFSLPSLLTRDLWNPDEPRYAEVALEMRVLGDYVVPHLNGDIYASGEESGDLWKLEVRDNIVTVKQGRITYD